MTLAQNSYIKTKLILISKIYKKLNGLKRPTGMTSETFGWNFRGTEFGSVGWRKLDWNVLGTGLILLSLFR